MSAPLNPYVFIVGAPRSGTTLLKRIVDAHPQVATTRETHWITELIRDEQSPPGPLKATRQLRSTLASHKRFARLRGDFARTKTPRYVRHLPTLHALWPKAKFVHLIRDGRDVCSSVLGWQNEKRMVTGFSSWDTDPVSTIAVWWEQLVRLGREAGADLPLLYHEVRYERLVSDERFEAAAGDLLDELGYDRGVPEPSARATSHARRVHASYVREAGRQRLPRGWQA